MSQVTVPYSHVPLAVMRHVYSAKVRELFVPVEGTSQPAYYNLTGILALWLGAENGYPIELVSRRESQKVFSEHNGCLLAVGRLTTCIGCTYVVDERVLHVVFG